MSALKTTYKALRSILFAAIVIVAAVYIGLYVILSVPAVQTSVKERAERELSAFLGGKVSIGVFRFYPFSEARLSDVEVFTPDGERCIKIDMLGAGVHLWTLLYEHRVDITYAEIIGLDGRVWQESPDSAINISFLLDAFSPKDKTKPPARFNLRLHNVVIRKSALSYDLRWKERDPNLERFDASHISLRELRADLILPEIKNDDFSIDLRRLSFKEKCGFEIEKLALKARMTSRFSSLSGFSLRLNGSEIHLSDIILRYDSVGEIKRALFEGDHRLVLSAPRLNLSDFKFFLPALAPVKDPFSLLLDISGNVGAFNVEAFKLKDSEGDFILSASGSATGIRNGNDTDVVLEKLSLYSAPVFSAKLRGYVPALGSNLPEYIDKLGNLQISASGDISMRSKEMSVNTEIHSEVGEVVADGHAYWNSEDSFKMSVSVDGSEVMLGALMPRTRLGRGNFSLDGQIVKNNKSVDFVADLEIPEIEYNGVSLTNIGFSGEKKGGKISASMKVESDYLQAIAESEISLAGESSEWNMDMAVKKLYPAMFGLLSGYNGYELSGKTHISLVGDNPDNLTGVVDVRNLTFLGQGGAGVNLESFRLTSARNDSVKSYKIESDILGASLEGSFTFKSLWNTTREMLAASFPAFIAVGKESGERADARFDFVFHPADDIMSFFRSPVRPYSDVRIDGEISFDGDVRCHLSAPYILQGNTKLICGTDLKLYGDRYSGVRAALHTEVPAKNDVALMNVRLSALSDSISSDIDWAFEKNRTATGSVSMNALIDRQPATGVGVRLAVNPSSFRLNGAEWNIGKADLAYSSRSLSVSGLRIWHDDQFVDISGSASAGTDDELSVKLADIDLSYIFEALNINYVTFGGIASGDISASHLFSGSPVLKTQQLYVKDLSYNGAVLGDGNLESHWENETKKVAINADIRDRNNNGARVRGGIYVARDSLSFEMDARKVNVSFLKPFMSAFTSDVGGVASGKVKLFGTFKDIDLTGRVFADSLSMKVDYTNVYYHGSDSVIMNPGRIDIPAFRLYDRNGNSAMLKGFVKHRYFHNPEFEFRLSDARNLLCYDTDRQINPDWYGTIYASGGGTLRGRPGIVSIVMDMATSPRSDFTFVLNETQTAADYTFLTFSDKKKKLSAESAVTIDLAEQFRRELKQVTMSKPSLFTMDIRCSVTPDARMNLVMDPVAGDKIQARGSGPLQISYNTDSDEMSIYGKYTLAEGNYNFSLQDLILRDFKINPGSSISFNGDPMQGILDIAATYRVNTNLSDLDKSFSTDRDLNRTNVPVDALLKVSGDMRSPEISFDIELPTLTQDVERKVKSIISTDDMMNRQIIYLLALNRFYTPEYMGATSNGGELASVASSTLSSQLSNMVGQLTDKVTFAPSFRSDKGDFSDMEVDLALSSRLLDNRLLINGNFGYRDKATSQTTFVGDFDIEYLLNKNGDLRLKAYNHFNDQYYYLKSALTTQGIGVVYRRDFDNPFTFLKRRRKKTEKTEPVKEDGIEGKEENGIISEEKGNGSLE